MGVGTGKGGDGENKEPGLSFLLPFPSPTCDSKPHWKPEHEVSDALCRGYQLWCRAEKNNEWRGGNGMFSI